MLGCVLRVCGFLCFLEGFGFRLVCWFLGRLVLLLRFWCLLLRLDFCDLVMIVLSGLLLIVVLLVAVALCVGFVVVVLWVCLLELLLWE